MVAKKKTPAKLLTEVEFELMGVLWRLQEASVNEVLAGRPAGRDLASSLIFRGRCIADLGLCVAAKYGRAARRGLAGLFSLQLDAVDFDSVLDEEAFKQGHFRDFKRRGCWMRGVEIASVLQGLPKVRDLLDCLLHPFKIAQMIGFDVKDAARSNERGHRAQAIRREPAIFELGFFGPRVRKIKRKKINFARAKHIVQAIGVSAQKNQIAQAPFEPFFSSPKNGFELPIDSDKGGVRIAGGPFHDHVPCVASNLDVERTSFLQVGS